MDQETAQIVSLLMREYLFQGLSTEQLQQIADLFTLTRYEREETIFREGERGNAFYVVFSGGVRVTRLIPGARTRAVSSAPAGGPGVPRQRPERLLNVLRPGDFFGEEALLFNRPRVATMTAIEPTALLRMPARNFFTMLARFPRVRDTLLATAESRRLARQMRFDWLSNNNEVIYLVRRRHEFFLLVHLLAPSLFAISGLPMLVFGYMSSSVFLLALGGLLLFIGVLWGIWNAVDWANDYYIITNQRVIWLEKVFLLYDSRREAPLDSIMTTDVITSQVGRIIGYGNVNVRTYTGGILMRNMKLPYQFASFVDGYKNRVVLMSREKEARLMEQDLEVALRKRLHPAEAEVGQPLPPPRPPAPPPPPKRQSINWREIWNNFLKVRYEQNGVITYRRHWLILMEKAWLPLIITVLLFAGLFALIYFRQLAPLTIVIWLLLFGIISVWLAYHYVDWINDIYRLTPTQIMDLERKPLGREQKKTANLDSPDFRVEHIRKNLIGIVFNFGNVIVNVGQTEFTFDGVYNPDQVHQDVTDYREALIRRKRAAEQARERERMIDWLVIFAQQAERLEEFENPGDGNENSG